MRFDGGALRTDRARRAFLWCGVAWVAASGCRLPPTQPASARAATSAPSAHDAALDSMGATSPLDASSSVPLTARMRYTVTVLHVQIPVEQLAAMDAVWRYIREDELPGDVQWRLERNGFRAGIGSEEFWPAIKEIIDAIEGRRVTLSNPVQAQAGFPLALELDDQPRDQLLFYVGPDGVLSGDTWPQSRNVLRVSIGPDATQTSRALLEIAPEVRQRLEGMDFVRTEAGVWQVPKRSARLYDAVALTLPVRRDEFVLIGPSESAQIDGLIGRAFLSATVRDVRYHSYVFIRPELIRVDER
ncbi:MAG: hypothetical protein D6744_18810 [Planctomycetota bacterium]|nr:MAG: hypothetical protein D6744_18810 [Planctomycetota bacterium]